jgi:hypothetical protein
MALADPAEPVLLVERVDTGPANDRGGVSVQGDGGRAWMTFISPPQIPAEGPAVGSCLMATGSARSLPGFRAAAVALLLDGQGTAGHVRPAHETEGRGISRTRARPQRRERCPPAGRRSRGRRCRRLGRASCTAGLGDLRRTCQHHYDTHRPHRGLGPSHSPTTTPQPTTPEPTASGGGTGSRAAP